MKETDGRLEALDESEHERRVRRYGFVIIVVIALTLISTIMVAGAEYLHIAAWLLVPGGLGILGATKILRHPERVGRIESRHGSDHIIARGGLEIPTATDTASQVEARLALQDALDSLRRQRGSPRLRVAARLAAGLGTFGWFAGAVASVVTNDPAAAGICVLAAAAFASLGVYLARQGKRLRTAEDLLHDQLQAVERGSTGVDLERDGA
jgi:hypothetical protein